MLTLKYDFVLICPLLRRNGINFRWTAFKPAARSWQSAATYSEHAMKFRSRAADMNEEVFPGSCARDHREFTDVTPTTQEVEAQAGFSAPGFLICF